jgi:hypothetical protein
MEVVQTSRPRTCDFIFFGEGTANERQYRKKYELADIPPIFSAPRSFQKNFLFI